MAALGVAGIASQANASVTVVTLDYAYNTGHDQSITLDGAGSSQFFYDSVRTRHGHRPDYTYTYNAYFGTDDNLLKGVSGEIATTGVNGVAAIDPNLTYQKDPLGLQVSNNGTLLGSGFVNLEFNTGSNTPEIYGYASFDLSGDLETITYGSVPEPSTWALLIAGAGVVGIATRRRRRQPVSLAV